MDTVDTNVATFCQTPSPEGYDGKIYAIGDDYAIRMLLAMYQQERRIRDHTELDAWRKGQKNLLSSPAFRVRNDCDPWQPWRT